MTRVLILLGALAAAGCARSPAIETVDLPAAQVMRTASDVRFRNDGPESVVTRPACGLERPVPPGQWVRVWMEGERYRCELVETKQ